VGGINKGKFKREDGTSCNLYLSSSKAPYIVFTDYSGREIYYNSSSKEKTLLIYRQLEPIFRNEDIKGELKPGADKLTYSAADKALLDSIDHIKGIVKTASGLRYKVVSDGEGTKPSENSNIVIAYRGLHADGSLFWENEKEEFSLKGTIKGFSEGVGLMSVGSKYMLYIPSALGYGSKGIKDLIKPDEPLIYEVTLLEVK
jgi:FKBP-type peptidyl-prolyl cis-trans isomerase FkpA